MLRQRDGHLTRDLLRAPGGFGLGQVPARVKPDATTDMVCGYCSTGCSLTVHLRDGEAVGLTPAVDYPVNRGVACPKGWEALAVLEAGDRATVPLRRDAGGVPRAASWDAALRTMVDRFRGIQARHGPEAVAFLGTGQMATEELALLGALAKFGMGMVHGDGNTRQCMATSVVAYKQAFGFDAPPYTYRDSRNPTSSCSWAPIRASRIPSCGSACSAIRTIPPSSSSIRASPRRQCRRPNTWRRAPSRTRRCSTASRGS